MENQGVLLGKIIIDNKEILMKKRLRRDIMFWMHSNRIIIILK